MTDNLQFIHRSPLSSAPSPRLYTYDRAYRSALIFILFLLGGLFLLDVFTTEFILSNGGQELNAFMVGVVNCSGIWHFVIKCCVMIMTVVTVFYSNSIIKHSGTGALILVVGWYVSVIMHNLSVIFL
ncbi:MAG: hypothetical protein IK060_02990 [Methanomicrobium sp.]|nr:hypothetical protein [Methanomicrobium sp.]MBR6011295.1 hypothetical protein [Methanomicrobium sp.]